MSAAQTSATTVAAATLISRHYFSERELSLYSGIAVRTLQSWRLRSQGPHWKKFQGAVKYNIQAFEDWATSCPGGGGRT
jgi:hypothetical protein